MDEDLKLTIELVPATSYYDNVRKIISERDWNQIRSRCYTQSGFQCDVCYDNGIDQGRKQKVCCHEIWHYDDKTHTQRLVGFTSLCPLCHQVKHAGLANLNNKIDQVISQLEEVNEMTKEDAENYLVDCFAQHKYRSRFDWNVDVTYLYQFISE